MIELRVSTEKNINELTSNEVKSILWHRLPNDQIDLIDLKVYRKLDAAGRLFVNGRIFKFDTRPIEYWDEVFKHKVECSFCINLIENKNNSSFIYERYKEQLDKHISLSDKYNYGIISFDEYFESVGIELLYEANDYRPLLNPNIPITSFTKKFSEEQTVLQYIFEQLDDNYSISSYPILLPNAVLVAAGFPVVPNFSEESLNDCDACIQGRRTIRPWIEKLGIDGVLGWDTVVSYIRDNPELIQSFGGELEWWWENNVEV